jgi:hypothetical protein
MKKKEVEERFHPLQVACPTCKQSATILDVMFSSRGSVALKLICVTCGEGMELKTSWDKIICYCAENELDVVTVFEGNSTIQ